MKGLFETYNHHSSRLGLRMEVYHSNIVDWRITIDHRTMGTIVDVQHCDYQYVFAKAQVNLKEWLSEHNGGY